MATREIPKAEWEEFFEDFSKEHQGQHIDIELAYPGGDRQWLAQDYPLDGVIYEPRQGSEDTLTISTWDPAGKMMDHFATLPKRIRLDQSEQGQPNVMRIETAGGATTVVHFHAYDE